MVHLPYKSYPLAYDISSISLIYRTASGYDPILTIRKILLKKWWMSSLKIDKPLSYLKFKSDNIFFLDFFLFKVGSEFLDCPFQTVLFRQPYCVPHVLINSFPSNLWFPQITIFAPFSRDPSPFSTPPPFSPLFPGLLEYFHQMFQWNPQFC
jgi:hypothetical protein